MAIDVTDHIDPLAEFVPRHIDPKPFRWDAIDPANVAVSYDRRSDTLLIHLFGRGHDTISVPVAGYLYALVTPDSEAVVGFHIEGFLSQAVKDIPEAIDLLGYAEVRGITPAEVDALQRETLGNGHRRRSGLGARAIDGEPVQEQRLRAVAAFIDAERSRWNITFVPAAV
jgi:hypothetical protein